LQLAAARRAGARERADYSGTRVGVSRRAVERHQVLWGSEWDPILERDTEGLLVKRMGELVDGEYQKLVGFLWLGVNARCLGQQAANRSRFHICTT